MHFLLYVCLPGTRASTSYQARKKVCEYLNDEGFTLQLRFGGRCDYFCVGGRCTGQLTLLRLRQEQPKQLGQFWKRRARLRRTKWEEESAELFGKMFPKYRGKSPFNRKTSFHGVPEDAQIMDKPLFRQLKAGFNEEVKYATDDRKPNVIFTDDDSDSEWPKTVKEAAKFWVVVIDYHD